MVAATVSEFGRLDWASNNAVGGGGAMKRLHETDNAVWSSTMDVCLDGVFNCMKAEVPAMMEAGGGSIVNIITASVFKGEAMLGAYIAAKGGVDALTRTGAAEYAGCGIRVNSVAPGGFETPQIANYFRKVPGTQRKNDQPARDATHRATQGGCGARHLACFGSRIICNRYLHPVRRRDQRQLSPVVKRRGASRCVQGDHHHGQTCHC